MKPRHFFLLLTLSMWTAVLFAQQPDTIQTDSIPNTQNWTPREPLSPTEQQRRADQAAELESMRKRFRRYQQGTRTAEQERAAETAGEDYLWAEGEAPPPAVVPADSVVGVQPKARDTEKLRLEIGRSLQVKGETTTTPSSTERPTSYDLPRTNSPAENWEEEWQVEAPPTAPPPKQDTEWALELEQTASPSPTTPAYPAGTILPLNVSFAPGGIELAQVPQPQLEEWTQILRTQPELLIEVRAHAHVALSKVEADRRSSARAEAVVSYWTERGVAPARVRARGYGKRAPLSFDRSAEGQSLNERLEVIVLQH